MEKIAHDDTRDKNVCSATTRHPFGIRTSVSDASTQTLDSLANTTEQTFGCRDFHMTIQGKTFKDGGFLAPWLQTVVGVPPRGRSLSGLQMFVPPFLRQLLEIETIRSSHNLEAIPFRTVADNIFRDRIVKMMKNLHCNTRKILFAVSCETPTSWSTRLKCMRGLCAPWGTTELFFHKTHDLSQ